MSDWEEQPPQSEGRTCVRVLDVTELTNGSDTPSLSSAARPATFWMAGKQAVGGAERSRTPVMLRLHSQVFWNKGNAFWIVAIEFGSLDKDPYHQYILQSIAQPCSKSVLRKKNEEIIFFHICPETLILLHASIALHCFIMHNIYESPLHNILAHFLPPEAEPLPAWWWQVRYLAWLSAFPCASSKSLIWIKED